MTVVKFDGMKRLWFMWFFFAESLAVQKLTVVHSNDIHSWFDQVSPRGSPCKEERVCLGGVARIKYQMDILERTKENLIYLNAGDIFQGTVWYKMFKWRIVANLTSGLGFTAACLGNHEFDDGVPDLVSFAETIRYPLLACNLDLSHEPDLQRLIQPSLIINLNNNVTVGVIGYITPRTKGTTSTGKVIFKDEIQSLREEVQRLQADNITFIIALGHSGFDKDVEIAQQVNGLSLVIGGHTNTLLWNGEKADFETDSIVGSYPFVTQNNVTGKPVLVVQTTGLTRYLGVLELRFNETGDLLWWSKNNPIPLNGEEDPHLRTLVNLYGQEIHKELFRVEGMSTVDIPGGKLPCRLGECEFGNLITDAMREGLNVSFAVMNGGGIRGSLQQGNITLESIYIALPYMNIVDVVVIPGSTLIDMMEQSVSGYHDPEPSGRFLQISGLKVSYDLSRPEGYRVIKVTDSNGYAVNPKSLYKIAVPSFIIKGGDGYDVISQTMVDYLNTGMLDTDLLLSYIKKHSPLVQPQPNNRIAFLTSSSSYLTLNFVAFSFLLLCFLP